MFAFYPAKKLPLQQQVLAVASKLSSGANITPGKGPEYWPNILWNIGASIQTIHHISKTYFKGEVKLLA